MTSIRTVYYYCETMQKVIETTLFNLEENEPLPKGYYCSSEIALQEYNNFISRKNQVSEPLLKELQAVLEKYNASISFSVDDISDTRGLYDEKLVINATNLDTNEDYEIELNKGWSVSHENF